MNQTTQPGWYQDPFGAGLRYWDGRGWTGHTSAGAQPQAPPAQPPYQQPMPGPQPQYPPTAPQPQYQGHYQPQLQAPGAPATAKRPTWAIVALVAAAVFGLCTFLPWFEYTAGGESDQASGWDGKTDDGAPVMWAILGASSDEIIDASGIPDSTSDMLIIAPLVAVAGVAAAIGLGSQADRRLGTVVLIAGAAATALIGFELYTFWSGVSDLEDIFDVGGGPAIGAFLGLAACVVIVVAGIQLQRESRAA